MAADKKREIVTLFDFTILLACHETSWKALLFFHKLDEKCRNVYKKNNTLPRYERQQHTLLGGEIDIVYFLSCIIHDQLLLRWWLSIWATPAAVAWTISLVGFEAWLMNISRVYA